jgi:hypothetical protein
VDLRGHEGSALVLAVAEPGLEVVGEGSQVADLQIPRTVSVDGDVRTRTAIPRSALVDDLPLSNPGRGLRFRPFRSELATEPQHGPVKDEITTDLLLCVRNVDCDGLVADQHIEVPALEAEAIAAL